MEEDQEEDVVVVEEFQLLHLKVVAVEEEVQADVVVVLDLEFRFGVEWDKVAWAQWDTEEWAQWDKVAWAQWDMEEWAPWDMVEWVLWDKVVAVVEEDAVWALWDKEAMLEWDNFVYVLIFVCLSNHVNRGKEIKKQQSGDGKK